MGKAGHSAPEQIMVNYYRFLGILLKMKKKKKYVCEGIKNYLNDLIYKRRSLDPLFPSSLKTKVKKIKLVKLGWLRNRMSSNKSINVSYKVW